MAESIIANELSTKQINSNEVKVNGENITDYLKKEVSKLELDPVFKHWLSSESNLSSIGKNEISSYAKKSEVPTDLTDLTGSITKDKISDFGTYLSSSITLSDINNNEITSYAKNSYADDISGAVDDLKDYVDDIGSEISVNLNDELGSIIIEMSKLITKLGGTVIQFSSIQ